VTATLHWDKPVVARSPRPEDGPALVLIEYRIAPDQTRAFARAMRAWRRVRLRDGAFRWGLFGDTGKGLMALRRRRRARRALTASLGCVHMMWRTG
jgi:hypothetical protein